VDYDLETGKPCRQQFYREIKKIIGEPRLADTSSSLSVIATRDEKAALAVQKLAAKCGRANLYKVKQTKTLIKRKLKRV
jgi:hypothetical protein